MSADKISVYVVEDDLSFRKSTERLIRASGFEVISFGSADAFLAETSIRHPACLVLDVRLPGIDGLCLQQKLIERGSLLPIIFMTGHGDIPMSVQAMRNGAVDFLPKPFEAKDLRNAIAKAIEKDTRECEKEVEVTRVQVLINALSPREHEVLRWVITGKLNKQIADAINVTEKTVKAHRGQVMKKLKADSVADLIRLSQKVGIAPAIL